MNDLIFGEKVQEEGVAERESGLSGEEEEGRVESDEIAFCRWTGWQ